MRIDAWMENREQPGTLAHTARRILENDKAYRDAEKTLRSMYVLEALIKSRGNQRQAARDIGVSWQTVRRILRSMKITGADIRKLSEHLRERSDAGNAA
jgi:DNA-binding NtrC family response regulator